MLSRVDDVGAVVLVPAIVFILAGDKRRVSRRFSGIIWRAAERCAAGQLLDHDISRSPCGPLFTRVNWLTQVAYFHLYRGRAGIGAQVNALDLGRCVGMAGGYLQARERLARNRDGLGLVTFLGAWQVLRFGRRRCRSSASSGFLMCCCERKDCAG